MEPREVYLDNGSTTFPKPREVTQAVIKAMHELSSANRSVAPSSLGASRMLLSAREQLALLLGARSPRQVAFTSGATESLNMAIAGLCRPGDHVLTTVMEHNSVLRPLTRLREQGLSFDGVNLNEDLGLDLQDARQKLRANTKALLLNHASNVTGRVNDLASWSKFAKAHGLAFVVDASQSAGLLPINMMREHIDVLCFSGHKCLYGPQGVGCILVREDIGLEPWKLGGTGIGSAELTPPQHMPERLEAGTYNIHGIAGLLAGVDWIQRIGLGQLLAHGLELRNRFVQGIASIPRIHCIDPAPPQCVPLISCTIQGMGPELVAKELVRAYAVVARSGLHCAPFMHQALGTLDQGGTLRFSFSHFNTPSDVDQALTALEAICTRKTSL